MTDVLQSRSHSEWLDAFLTEEVHPAHYSTSRGDPASAVEDRLDPVRLRREAGEGVGSTETLTTAPPYKVTLVVAGDGRLGVEVGSYKHLDKEPTFVGGFYSEIPTGVGPTPKKATPEAPAPAPEPEPVPEPAPDPDPDGDGIDTVTGLPVGVIRDAASPTGFSFEGQPVNRDGSPA